MNIVTSPNMNPNMNPNTVCLHINCKESHES